MNHSCSELAFQLHSRRESSREPAFSTVGLIRRPQSPRFCKRNSGWVLRPRLLNCISPHAHPPWPEQRIHRVTIRPRPGASRGASRNFSFVGSIFAAGDDQSKVHNSGHFVAELHHQARCETWLVRTGMRWSNRPKAFGFVFIISFEKHCGGKKNSAQRAKKRNWLFARTWVMAP